MNQQIAISKYNASGNDFVIFHTFLRGDYSKLAKTLCHRTSGVGADGLVVILPASVGDVDFEWDFYNSDGSAAGMCGNASRAVAHYAFKNQLVSKKQISFLSASGVIQTQVFEHNQIETTLTPHKIINANIAYKNKPYWLADTGVPHIVAVCDDLDEFNLSLARELRQKYEANVNWVMVKDGNLFVRTYERGVEDETLACGTGISAAFLRVSELGLVSEQVTAYPKSNKPILVQYKNGRLSMRGEVSLSFRSVVAV